MCSSSASLDVHDHVEAEFDHELGNLSDESLVALGDYQTSPFGDRPPRPGRCCCGEPSCRVEVLA